MEIVPPTSRAFPTETLHFPNHRQATILRAPMDAKGEEVVAQLGLDPAPKALITLSGGASGLEEALRPRLLQLITRGVARAAAASGADVLDGGSDSGVMAMMGQGVSERGCQSRIIGIAPAGKVTYPGQENPPIGDDVSPLEPHHSHFVLVDSEQWGEEANLMFKVAGQLVETHKIPVITVLVNGGALSRQEVLRAVRNGWPIIVVTGSGRLADEISDLAENPPEFIPDEVLAEILAEGDIHLFPITGTAAGLERLIQRQLRGDGTLRLAWERFAQYDANATRHQQFFHNLQVVILVLGVVGTFLAIVQSNIEHMIMLASSLPLENNPVLQAYIADSKIPAVILETWYEHVVQPNRWLFKTLRDLLGYVIVLIPITAAILLAATNRFNSGTKWLLLRGSAEAIKREIFRYRANAEIYSDRQTLTQTKEAKLAQKINDISRQLMQTEVNLSALHPYTDKIPPPKSTAERDDGMSPLTADQYLLHRVDDQFIYYCQKTNRLERKLYRLQWLIYIIGGVGTLFAYLGLELWIALTGALVAAFGTYLEYRQIENTLLKYNQAATDLSNVRGWWVALTAQEQEKQENIDMLVRQTQRILQSEFSGWMQDMQDALSMLKEHQEKTEENANQGQQNFLASDVLSNRITRYTGGAAGDSLKAYAAPEKPEGERHGNAKET